MNKASGGDGIPADLFQILKDAAAKVLHSIWKNQQCPQDWKSQFHFNLKEGQCQRMFNYCVIVLISHASEVMLNIFQARFQQYMNGELSDVQDGFRKG